MVHVKRMAVTALAALMIAGAVPALADSYTADDVLDSAPAQQETVVKSGRKAHKKSASGDTADDTGDTASRRKPSKKSADSEETSETSVDSGKTAEKRSRKSADGEASASADSGKSAKKPAKKSTDAQSGDSSAADTETGVTREKPSERPARRPARKPEKKSTASSDNGDSANTAS